MKLFLFFILTLSMTACLKTRSELRSDGNPVRDAEGRFVTGGNVNQQQRAQIDSRFFEIDKDFREL
ncbi:MAG: hypothetical protein AAF203_00385 [Pseudomonadota bacterium]